MSNLMIIIPLKLITGVLLSCLFFIQEDVFIVTAVELGTMKKLRIRHDNSSSYPSWYLDRVEILDTKEDIT